ncbi:MAG: hypothetical protein WCH98_23075, partial [Verrucomicrobiota bacterium]
LRRGSRLLETNRKKFLTPIIIEKHVEKVLAGYIGHDEFEVMENTFVRLSPVYKAGDPNAGPTGGYRQIHNTNSSPAKPHGR